VERLKYEGFPFFSRDESLIYEDEFMIHDKHVSKAVTLDILPNERDDCVLGTYGKWEVE
jgi:hypothetical protein